MARRFVFIVTAFLSVAICVCANGNVRDVDSAHESLISNAEQLLTAGRFNEIAPLFAKQLGDGRGWERILPKIYSDIASKASDLPQGIATELSL